MKDLGSPKPDQAGFLLLESVPGTGYCQSSELNHAHGILGGAFSLSSVS